MKDYFVRFFNFNQDEIFPVFFATVDFFILQHNKKCRKIIDCSKF